MRLARSLAHFSMMAAALMAASAAFATAQQVYTAADYARAERWMPYNVEGKVQHKIAGVEYLPDGRVFFRDPGPHGTAYMLADPAAGTQRPAFNAGVLAAALRGASGLAFAAENIGVTSYKPERNGGFAVTAAGELRFHCNAGGERCTKEPELPAGFERPVQKPNAQPPAGGSTTATGGNAQMASRAVGGAMTTEAGKAAQEPFDVSPDGKLAAFIRGSNLWVRVLATGEERALTMDGVADFGYATDNAGWTHSDKPIVVWSADSAKIATFQQDERKTGWMYTVPMTNRHPKLEAWHYPLLGDKDVTTIQRVVIDVPTGTVVRLQMPPDQHRSTLCDDVSCRGGAGWDDVQFAPDGRTVAFVSSSRDHKDAWLRVADTATGAVREVFHEHVPTYYESGQGKVNWRYLPGSGEFLWYSERTDWGQMYLGDLATGKLKNAITSGDGPVTEVLHVDEKNRVLYFLATGKESGQDPYFAHYYRADFDGSHQALLTPEVADHAITPSPDGSTFVDVASTHEMPQTATLRDNTGKVLLTLAREDISELKAAGWKPPTPFTVKARDGKTPLYGFLWKPTNFDATRTYPIIDYVYPGPFTGSCGTRGFTAAEHDNQSLAELGFIVICLDGMGTPFRSKSFHDAQASTPAGLAEDTIPDQVAGIRELAGRFAWIDLNRVGIWGHSGGGNATASAMFHYPDFFKVGIAESGNHDSREYEDDWDEKWAGLEKVGPDGKSNYDVQGNQNFAANLKGHLLLAHGTVDDNVPFNNTLLVVDALIKANKDFDLIVFPNAVHHYGAATNYMTRRRWDYFVRYLAGGTPPHEYKMHDEE